MVRIAQNLHLSLIFSALLFFNPLLSFADSNWSIVVNNTSSVYTGVESVSGTTILGSINRLGNGFIETTVTNSPGNGVSLNDIFYPVEVPGLFFMQPPLVTGEDQMTVSVESGSCPSESRMYNWVFMNWDAQSNTSNASQLVYGEFFWDSAGGGSARIQSIFDVVNHALPAWWTTPIGLNVQTCAGGVANVVGAPNSDQAGTLYMSAEGGFVYQTEAKHIILGLPQVKMPSVSMLKGTYTSYLTRYDTSQDNATNIKPVRITIASGSNGNGFPLSNPSTGATDTGYGSVNIDVATINSPKRGMFEGTIRRGASTGNIICIKWSKQKNILFCAGQMEGANSTPTNIIMFSDEKLVGAADESFNTTGTPGGGSGVVTDNPDSADDSYYEAVKVDSDGKVIAAGYLINGTEDATVGRYLTSGAVDTSFDSDGVAVINHDLTDDDRFYDLALLGSGEVVAAGYSRISGRDFMVAKLNSDGTLNTTFSSDGVATIEFSGSSSAYGIQIDSDGKYVVGGWANVGSNNFAIARLNTDGSLDTTLGTGGLAHIDCTGGSRERAYAMALQTDGKIVLVGETRVGGSDRYAVARFNTDGGLDSTFSGDGKIDLNPTGGEELARDVVIQSDGGIVVGGDDGSDFRMFKLDTGGSLDTSFGTSGYVVTDFFGNNDRIRSLVQDSDGRIYAGGRANNSFHEFAIARYFSDGNLDTEFGSSGKWTGTLGTNNDQLFDITVDNEGRITAAGRSRAADSNNDAVLIKVFP